MDSRIARETMWLKASVAFIWIVTGVLFIHPYYREVGNEYLSKLSCPSWLMGATCLFEIALGIRLLCGNQPLWLALLQGSMILVFTVILAWIEPNLMVHPFGILTKNLPLLFVIGVIWHFQKHGLTSRNLWFLRVGMALIWLTEGLFPKIFFQQEFEVQVVQNSGLVPIDPSVFLTFMGVAQFSSGVFALLLRGRWLGFILIGQMFGLWVLPLLVGIQDLRLFVHPFGPLTKNVPILVGTFVVFRLCLGSSLSKPSTS